MATLTFGLVLVLLPWLAPHGALPFVLAVCMGCVLLQRQPRIMAAVAVLVFFVGYYQSQKLLVFSIGSVSSLGKSFGDHNYSSDFAVFLSGALTALFVIMPCSFCCAAHGISKQNTTVLVPMVPMVSLGTTGSHDAEMTDTL